MARMTGESGHPFPEAEAALWESEERFRATFEQAAVGIAHVAPDGRWLRVNQRMCEIVGYPHHELVAISFQDVTHPDDLSPDLALVDRALSGEISHYSLEKRYVRRDGEVIWANLTVSLIRDEAGAPKFFISVVEDISRAKAAEEALRHAHGELEERVRFRTLELETANRALREESARRLEAQEQLRREMRHGALLQKAAIAANEAATVEEAFQTCLQEVCALTGWAAGHAELYDLAPDKGTTSVYLSYDADPREARVLEGDTALRCQVRVTGKPAWQVDVPDGAGDASASAEHWWRGVVVVPVCVHNQVAGVLEFYSREPLVQDPGLLQVMEHVGTQLSRVVERAQSERHLSQQAQLLDLANDTIIIRDLDGCIRSWNRGAEQTYGWTRTEAVGQCIHTLLQTQFPDPVEKVVEALFQAGHWQGELHHTRRDGETLIVESRKVLQRDADGWPTGVLEINRDVTDRRRAEGALEERARELARSNADLEQFANVASHDLQEPLRMVASYTQLLAKRYGGQLDERADQWIGYAVDGANRMQALINALLTYSRVGTRGGELAAVSAEAALQSALANLRLAIRESEAEIIHPPLPSVLGDEPQLVHLFQNLVGNALKFRGTEAPRIEVTARQDGDEWVFSVRDNGIGVAPEFAERIFIIFQRLHERHRYPGTGIGLAISKRIVERHGGRIWLESELGQGASFFFTLRAAPAER